MSSRQRSATEYTATRRQQPKASSPRRSRTPGRKTSNRAHHGVTGSNSSTGTPSSSNSNRKKRTGNHGRPTGSAPSKSSVMRPTASSAKKRAITAGATRHRGRTGHRPHHSNSRGASEKERRRIAKIRNASLAATRRIVSQSNIRNLGVAGESKDGSNIRVAVRSRPLTRNEIELESTCTLDVIDNRIIVLRDPREQNSNDPLIRSRESKYQFDVALPPDCSNRQVYESTARQVVSHVVNGQNGTVFAYGATGSGKTYTMAGTPEQPGIMYYTIHDLFDMLQDRIDYVSVVASYLEIYNEHLVDLLSPSSDIDMREDPERGVQINGVKEFEMECAEDVFQVLSQGATNRTTDSHNLNEASSRSHAVLMIRVEQRPFYDAQKGEARQALSSLLTMIDLAGSERAKKTGATKKLLQEGAMINRSLLALANCINALANRKKKGVYIPYRDSKLTRLLKESIGGHAYTVMIACVSIATSQFDETRETLLYGNRAKNIKVDRERLKRRRATQVFDRKDYEKVVADLQSELHSLRQALHGTGGAGSPMMTGSPVDNPAHGHTFGSNNTAAGPHLSDMNIGSPLLQVTPVPAAQAKPAVLSNTDHLGRRGTKTKLEIETPLLRSLSISPAVSVQDALSNTDGDLSAFELNEDDLLPHQLVESFDSSSHSYLTESKLAGTTPAFVPLEPASLDRRKSLWEKNETNELVARIVSNFELRIQVRHSLVELEETDALNRRDLEEVMVALSELHAIEDCGAVVDGLVEEITLARPASAVNTPAENSARHRRAVSNRSVGSLEPSPISRPRRLSTSSQLDEVENADLGQHPDNDLHSILDADDDDEESTLSQSTPRDKLVRALESERHALVEGLSENARYKSRLVERRRELKSEGAKLRRKVTSVKLKSERRQILVLTLERCVLELYKYELQLQARVLQMQLEYQVGASQYYLQLLQQHGIPFKPYDQTDDYRGPSQHPLPTIPDLKDPHPERHPNLKTPKATLKRGMFPDGTSSSSAAENALQYFTAAPPGSSDAAEFSHASTLPSSFEAPSSAPAKPPANVIENLIMSSGGGGSGRGHRTTVLYTGPTVLNDYDHGDDPPSPSSSDSEMPE
jgi:Kinesin motor domain